VVASKPGRKLRICEVLKHATEKMNTVQGDIVPYFHINGKIWTVWFDCLRGDKLQATTDHIEANLGLRVIHQTSLLPKPIGAMSRSVKTISFSSKTSSKEESVSTAKNELSLFNGRAFELEVGGDLQVSANMDTSTPILLTYHNKLEHNYRRLSVAPRSEGHVVGRSWTGILRVYRIVGPDERKCIRTYDFDIDQAAVDDALYVEPQPEPLFDDSELFADVDVQVLPLPVAVVRRLDVVPEKPPKDPRQAMESFLRLTRSTKPMPGQYPAMANNTN